MLYLLPYPLFRSWSIYLIPIEGVILGPYAGFFSALIGSVLARAVKPDIFWMFGIVAEPLSALAAGFLVRRQWKPVMAIYAFMLGAYFVLPFGLSIPLWTILDILVILFLIYPAARFSADLFGEDSKRLSLSLVLVAFVTTVVDSLARVVLLVPGGLYTLYGLSRPIDVINFVFIPNAVFSYVEDGLVVIVTLVVGVPMLLALRKSLQLKEPLS